MSHLPQGAGRFGGSPAVPSVLLQPLPPGRFGKWLDGGFKIESPASEEDLDEGLPTDGNRETEE